MKTALRTTLACFWTHSLLYLSVVLTHIDIIHSLCGKSHFEDEHGNCMPHLTCTELDKTVHHKYNITVLRQLPGGRVKQQHLSRYNEMLVVYNVPRDEQMREDFKHGLEMLLAFQDSRLVTRIVGYCRRLDKLMLLTKYYPHGSLRNLDNLLKNHSVWESFQIRARLSIDYTSILHFLHTSPEGIRVMCDSNSIEKTTSQYLITNDFRLIVNDLDALPRVIQKDGVKIKCGHKQLFGEFVAPEQLWPYEDQQFSDVNMKGYDEKTDVWKTPDVLNFILGSSSYSMQAKFRLFPLFRRCKEINASVRPSMFEIRETLTFVLNELQRDEL